MGSGAWSVRLWAPSGGAGAALGGAVRAFSATPLGVPGKALRLRWPGGYQARLRSPGSAVSSKTTHPLNIIDFTTASSSTAAAAMPPRPAAGAELLTLAAAAKKNFPTPMGPVFAPYVRRPPDPSASAGGRSTRETAHRQPTTDRVCAPAGGGGGDVADLWPRARTALAASWVAWRGRRCCAFIGGEDMCPEFAQCVQRLSAPSARAGGRRFRDAFHRQPHGDAVTGMAGGDGIRPGDAVAREGGGEGPGLAGVAGVGEGDGAFTT